jgi:hypothetical protein
MKAYERMDVQIHVFLTSALVDNWSASRLGRFTADGLWIGGCVGSRDCVDDVERRKILLLPGLQLQPLGHTIPAAYFGIADGINH